MIYKCECGREFNNSQSFNGHKSHCKVHSLAKGKSLKQLNDEAKFRGQCISIAMQLKQENEKNLKELQKVENLEQWINEQHTCERCGKVMTEKFGSGRFCCRSCANGRPHSKEEKEKISKAIKQRPNCSHKLYYISKYEANPNYCIICNEVLSYSKRFRKTCCDKCNSIRLSQQAKKYIKKYGGNLNSTRNAKYGVYKDIPCDSSYELAYLIYCLDHNIKIKRNTQSFQYKYNEEIHRYYPDFIVNDTYVEIKNYISKQVQAKIDYFPKNLKYQIICKDEIKKYIDYCKKKYGDEFTKLYDKSKPSYLTNKGLGTA